MASRQHDVVAVWQLQALNWSKMQVDAGLRGLRRVHRGVCALGDLTEEGWFMAAALAGGPAGVVSHLSALMAMGLRPYAAGDVHISVPRSGGRDARDGLIVHRRTHLERWTYDKIPVTSPTRSLIDANLPPHELYRALEAAEKRGIAVDHQALPFKEVVRLKRAITGFTRSDSEAKFLTLVDGAGLPLPLVNQHLHGFETDFHWPELRLVLEVDGFEHHKERRNFNADRYRGLVHRAHGWEVIRVSADHVFDEPELVLDALTLSLGPPEV